MPTKVTQSETIDTRSKSYGPRVGYGVSGYGMSGYGDYGRRSSGNFGGISFY